MFGTFGRLVVHPLFDRYGGGGEGSHMNSPESLYFLFFGGGAVSAVCTCTFEPGVWETLGGIFAYLRFFFVNVRDVGGLRVSDISKTSRGGLLRSTIVLPAVAVFSPCVFNRSLDFPPVPLSFLCSTVAVPNF